MFIKKFFCYEHKFILNIDEDKNDDGAGGDEDKDTLDEAIDKAAKDLNKDDKDDDEDNDEEDGEKSEDEDKSSKDDEEEEDDLTEDEKKQAKSIFKLLSDPNTSVEALRTLAAQAGLKLEKAETKEEKKEAKKAVTEIIKEKLGANYPHLADILGPALQEIINEAVKDGNKDIREKIANDQKEALKKEIVAAQEKVVSEFVDVPVKVLQEFVRMQENGEILPGPKQSPEKFFRAGIKEAAENLKVALVRKASGSNKEENKERKPKSPLDVLGSKGRQSAESGKDGIKSVHVKNFNDAIKLGVEAVNKSLKKG